MNFKQKTRVELKFINTLRETTFCAWRHVIFAVHSPMSLYCVLTHIPMTWHHDKVVQQRTSRATSRYSFITTVWWYNVLYQTGDFLKFQRKTYIMLDKWFYLYILGTICCPVDCGTACKLPVKPPGSGKLIIRR